MEQKNWVVDGRQFRTERDYKLALRDKELIDKLKQKIQASSVSERVRIIGDICAEKYPFQTMLGKDFIEELEELQQNTQVSNHTKATAGGAVFGKKSGSAQGMMIRTALDEQQIEADVQKELRRQEKNRRKLIGLCTLVGALFLGVFGYNVYRETVNDRNNSEYKEQLQSGQATSASMEKTPAQSEITGPQFQLDGPVTAGEVLEDYKNLKNQYPDLIGWLKIADTNIDYPVMQTQDNDYYLDHDLNGKRDKNGTIFMDAACDVVKGNTNTILYGHHMKSGKMFGHLVKYSDKNYYEKHKYIEFDTIYEKGTYEVMYVFLSRVYKEDEIVFKYYQFIDANGETEFESNMNEMAAMSLYSTGVKAQYGDELLTLSTCDYAEKDGRFVVVAKKVSAKE